MELKFLTAAKTADVLVERTPVEYAKKGQHDDHLVIRGDIRAGTLSDLRRAGWYVSGVHGRTTFLHRLD